MSDIEDLRQRLKAAETELHTWRNNRLHGGCLEELSAEWARTRDEAERAERAEAERDLLAQELKEEQEQRIENSKTAHSALQLLTATIKQSAALETERDEARDLVRSVVTSNTYLGGAPDPCRTAVARWDAEKEK